jgi:general secretion pathway protein G
MPIIERHGQSTALGQRGLSLIELIVCTLIIGILSGAALPLSRHYIRREREDLLREHLRTLREGIDRYRDRIYRQSPRKPESDCYPKTLDDLVAERIIRRVPVDPFTGKADWRSRSTSDGPQAEFSDGKNIFDVFSRAPGSGMNGVPYSDW